MDLFRETLAGQFVYFASGRKKFRHPEDCPDFQCPKRYQMRPIEEKHRQLPHPQPQPQSKQPNTSSAQSVDGPYFTPREEEDKRLDTGSQTPKSHSSTETAVVDESGHTKPKYGNEPLDVSVAEAARVPWDEVQTIASPNPDENPNLVDWYGPHDPANPRNWSVAKKCFVTFDLCFLTFSIYMGSSIVAPSIDALAQYFRVSVVVATLTLTLFVLGYGIGPMFLAPLSEIPSIGRNLPYIVTLAIFVGLQPAVATAKTPATYFILRFISGFFGSPALATGGASIADMFEPKKRAYGIGVWGISAVCGPTIGPLIGGFAFDALGWRWTIWPLFFLSATSLVWLFFLLPETSSTNILYRRAMRLRRVTGNKELTSTGEIMEKNMTGREIAMMTLVRPFLLNAEPIVGLLNLYIGFVYSLLYTFLATFPLVFQGVYGFNAGEEGLAFMGLFVGALVTYLGFCVYAYYGLEPLFERKGGVIDPEDRLIPAMFGCWCIPICLFGFGWTSVHSIHWIVPIIFSSFFSVGTFLLFQAILNYEGDAYPEYAASVLAGNDLFRSCMAAAFPLFAPQMFRNLQSVNGPSAFPVAWGSVLLGCIGIILCPLPFIFYRYGARIRRYSKYATNEPRKEVVNASSADGLQVA